MCCGLSCSSKIPIWILRFLVAISMALFFFQCAIVFCSFNVMLSFYGKIYFPRSPFALAFIPGFILALASFVFQFPLYFVFSALTCKEAQVCLKTNLILMILVTITCCSCFGCLYGISYHGTTIRQDMVEEITNYKPREVKATNYKPKTQAIDTFQQGYKCCGIDSYLDWNMNLYGKCNKSTTDEVLCKLPASCYKPKTQPSSATRSRKYLLKKIKESRSSTPSNQTLSRLQNLKKRILASAGQPGAQIMEVSTEVVNATSKRVISTTPDSMKRELFGIKRVDGSFYTEGCLPKVEEYYENMRRLLYNSGLTLIVFQNFSIVLLVITMYLFDVSLCSEPPVDYELYEYMRNPSVEPEVETEETETRTNETTSV